MEQGAAWPSWLHWYSSVLLHVFYPSLEIPPFDFLRISGLSSYFVLSVLPAIIRAKEALKWRLLMSGI